VEGPSGPLFFGHQINKCSTGKNMANKTQSSTIITNDDPSASRLVQRQLKDQWLKGENTTVGTTTVYQNSTAAVLDKDVLVQRALEESGEIVTVYKTEDDIFVNTVDQVFQQQFVSPALDSGVTKILAGNNISVSSTGPGGTGIVTVNSTAGAGSVTSVSGVGSGLGFSLSGTVTSVGNITLTTPSALELSNTLGINGNDKMSYITGAEGIVLHDFALGPVFFHTNVISDFTVNILNLNLSEGYGTSITLIIEQGAAPFIPDSLQIAGTAQTILWANSEAPLGIPGNKDCFSFSIVRTGSSYHVMGQLVSFGSPAILGLLCHFDAVSSAAILDYSGTNKTITKTSDANQGSTPAKFGSYAAFNSSGYLSVSDSADFVFGTRDFTVDFWFNQTSNTGNRCFFDTRYSTNNGFALYSSTSGDNRLRYVSNGGPTVVGTTALTNGVYHHVAVVRYDGVVKVYLNGALEMSVADTTNYSGTTNQIRLFNSFAGSQAYNGYLDEFRVVKNLAAWTGPFTPPTAPYANG
jgi:hypothetical protein